MKLRKLLALVVPHFVTEDVAVERCAHCPDAHPVCCMDDVHPGEVFDGIQAVSGFNLFGWMLFPRPIGEVRPWLNPHDAVRL